MSIYKKYTILIVEDDDVMRKTLTEVFAKKGFNAHSAECGKDAIKFIKKQSIDIAILDIRLPDMDGISVLREIQAIDDSILVIVMTAYPEVKVAISAIKAGAYDFINKPFELEELKLLVDKAVETQYLKSEVLRLQHKTESECMFKMVGESRGLKRIQELIVKVSKTPNTPVLIHGETGTGKELVANAIHCGSARNSMPMIRINCSAIPDNLMETELFGYEKGAFTDAKETKKGLMELADSGTIFFDEIGDMSLSLQPKLLRVLEEYTFRRVGGVRDIKADVRIIAATNKDLKALIKEGKFREDLYYRLNVMVIDVPLLRERKEDILPLAEYFIQEYAKALGKEVRRLSNDVKDILLNYSWHGNIRELKNIIERAVILAASSEINSECLPLEMTAESLKESAPPELPASALSLDHIEKNHIIKILKDFKYNKTRAANALGISRLTLRSKIKKYYISDKIN
ncbi:MAG: hypothetical protein A2073_05430 [Deltaproteobacteria bacterium GWC2_42_11]|nr:MAG: hypothetical protein A2073_05430 [Deltaproteobacteria bacterium GWC2_42_11]HBO83494.1 hypothetical protein [Deltaproteobacteria bacterium]